MTPKVHIIADDLTGALDVAGPFAARGHPTFVVVKMRLPAGPVRRRRRRVDQLRLAPPAPSRGGGRDPRHRRAPVRAGRRDLHQENRFHAARERRSGDARRHACARASQRHRRPSLPRARTHRHGRCRACERRAAAAKPVSRAMRCRRRRLCLSIRCFGRLRTRLAWSWWRRTGRSSWRARGKACGSSWWTARPMRTSSAPSRP